MTDPQGATLRRALGTLDATSLGLASMVGAGVFAVFAPAAAAAGGGLLVAVVLAGVIALCNAASSVQLAVEDPRAGGAYLWGRRHLGAWPGFVAGWCFVVGKTGSCAAIALVVADHLVPAPARTPAAIAVIALVTAVNCVGVQRTATAARVALVPVLLVLVVAIVLGAAALTAGGGAPAQQGPAPQPDRVLQAAGLLFFAFAGYARVTTLAEEVRDPARTLPRAVAIAVGAALALYLAAAAVLLGVLGPQRLAASDTPWPALAQQVSPWLTVPLAVAAVLAAAGSLLALVAGVSRTALAMARERDLPGALAVVHPRFRTPVRAEAAAAVAACLLVLVGDLRLVIGFSSFAVLVYYLVANLAALRQDRAHRVVPRAVHVVGAAGCAVLAVTLPWESAVVAAAVVLVGCAGRLLVRRRTPSPA